MPPRTGRAHRLARRSCAQVAHTGRAHRSRTGRAHRSCAQVARTGRAHRSYAQVAHRLCEQLLQTILSDCLQECCFPCVRIRKLLFAKVVLEFDVFKIALLEPPTWRQKSKLFLDLFFDAHVDHFSSQVSSILSENMNLS